MAQLSSPSVSSAPQTRRQPPHLLFKLLINPVMTAIVRSPLHGRISDRLLLLTFRGRKTGQRYTTPVGYVRDGDRLLMATLRPWSKNLRGGAPVMLRLEGRDRTGTADLIAGEPQFTRTLGLMLAAAPHLERAFGVGLDPGGEPNADQVARAKQEGLAIVEITLDAGS